MFGLLFGTCVGGVSLVIQSSFVTDPDGATVEGSAVGSHLQQTAVLAEGAVAADVEVVAYGAESSCFMVA